jgi:hypothetical protein
MARTDTFTRSYRAMQRCFVTVVTESSHFTNAGGVKTAHVKNVMKGKAVTVQAMKDIRGWGGGRRDDSNLSQSRYLPPGRFTPGKLLPVLTKRETGWDSKPVLKYYCPCLGVEPRPHGPTRSLVAIPTQPSRLFTAGERFGLGRRVEGLQCRQFEGIR